MKKTMTRLSLIILCIFCLVPAFMLSTGNYKLSRPGGMSTMGVILGPMILPDMNGGLTSDIPPADYSSANLSADTPYANGALRAYRSLGVYNVVRDSYSSNGFKYASFIRYFRITRTDGRPIYDEDGIVDVSSAKTNLTDEIINYPSYIYSIETTLPIKKNAGFLWTDEQAKFKNTTLNVIFGYIDANGTLQGVYDMPTNPSNSCEDYSTIMYKGTYGGNANYYDFMTITLTGTGVNSNTFWGGTGGDCTVNTNLTNYINIGPRDWSNTLQSSANKGKYNGKTTYYSPKPFTVVATNLNNYIKYNDVQATSQYATSVVPFRDGHHISIETEGYTKIDLEANYEGSYTTYYCVVDTKLPDVSYSYHNANALDNRRVGTITTGASGAKSQTINEGVFRDQVQVLFSYDETTESPETATYVYKGNTYNVSNGQWLTEEGDYTLTLTDKAGNTTISKFTIDKSSPIENKNKLENDKNLKISKWFLVDVPYGYTGSGSYSFRERNDAFEFAKNIERANKVSNYNLERVEDFTQTNLIARDNEVKIGPYWYYKSIDNPDLYVYYFDENSLNNAIEKYANTYVSKEQYYRINSSLYPNNYGNTIDDSVYDNIIDVGGVTAYIANDFIFRQSSTNESYKVYCAYQNGDVDVWKELVYNVSLKNQINTQGLYKIKEVDYVGHETYYYIYLDINSPMLDIQAKIYGKDKNINQTISKNDIPKNGELVYYYENFRIVDVIEDDKWWTLEVRLPNGTINRYTHLDELPNFEEFGSGEFTITIADRMNAPFSFKVYLLGKAPEVTFENINAGLQLQVKIQNKDEFNTITDVKIYRNNVCLNSEIGYDEFPLDDTNELIFIKPDTTKYVFNRGGIYVVEVTDNFGRTLTFEYKFEKELPTGILVGVEHNGATKNEVQFVYDGNKYFTIIDKNGNPFTPEMKQERNIITLNFIPEENSIDKYSIKLLEINDTENFNKYDFTIKTIKPNISLYGVEPNGTTGGDVYASWEQGEERYTATYTLKGQTQEYKRGQVLTAAGEYTITLADELGNENSVRFIIDKTISFLIADISGNIYDIEDIAYINFDVRIIEDEPLNITVTKDGRPYDYEFGLMIVEEGEYQISLVDVFNNTLYFSFTIDKTAPEATLYGVENFGVTSDRAWVTSMESKLTSWLVSNERVRQDYKLGSEITGAGYYKVFVADRANNITSFEFTIDNSIAYDINIYRGGISNGGVRIVAYENLKVYMYKDGELIDYEFEQILMQDGEYAFTLVDDLGNKTSSFFTIITKKKKNLNHIIQEGIVVTSITKNDENYEFEINDHNLYLHDEGEYTVNILDEVFNKEYSFDISIDTTPPTLEIIGVENGGSTKKKVILKNVSEKPYTIYITVDGVPFEYKLGSEIEKSGRFIVELTDEAGNTTTYTFERVYSLNGPSIAVLGGLGALVVLLIILLVKSRHRYYKDEEIIEEIEETVVEDDFDDKDNQDEQND